MSINFNDLGLSFQDKSKNVIINGQKVEVKQYLSIKDKIDLIQIVLQQGVVNDMYDEAVLEALFYVYTIMYYTDLEFTDEQKENPLDIYDMLISNDVLNVILSEIPEDEFIDLMDYFEKQKELNLKYQTSFTFVLNQIATKAEGVLKNLNEKDFEAITDLIKEKQND